MGVDWDWYGVGGIGVKVTSDMIELLINNGVFTDEEWEADKDECIDLLGILYSKAGNDYSGETYFYLFVDGKNLEEVNKNSKIFIEKLSQFGIILKEKDLIVVEDLCVY